ncbi:prolipoprotein diacylglyceryl transferase [Propylenella binzhouense]|uniref:Phosphatidylglycerol--prolipoprotein diacylglyceryl transferase n=1 Tax=Propylenella binzhouense TaxID=2555902 RepID=A0A964T5M0_9HYPH|nr:prolipoprotein diacylglyceryl transferase [Propylenella binzhouense]MYZ48855.1 prolipoprotein diacylglyceryl transferase [Propylenella binzhouense]
MRFPDIDPIAFQIGPVAVRWYGLAYLAGILLGWAYAKRLARTQRIWGDRPAPITPADIDDLLIWVTLGVVLGGRLGYAIFYQPGHFLDDPLGFFRLWQGGMSFHGGMLGTTLALVLFALRRRIPVLSLLDVAAAATPFGLFFGRIANFINGELWGRPSDVPWAMVFPGAGPEPRHPSQLYEAALEGAALFLALRFLTHSLRSLGRPGLTCAAFIGLYGLFRTIVEFFREPDPQLGFITGFFTMGMLLSIPMVIVGAATAAWAIARARR